MKYRIKNNLATPVSTELKSGPLTVPARSLSDEFFPAMITGRLQRQIREGALTLVPVKESPPSWGRGLKHSEEDE